MSDTLPIGLTYLSPVGNYSQHNPQALGGVSHLWQDFFARAMAEQQEEPVDSVSQSFVRVNSSRSTSRNLLPGPHKIIMAFDFS